ncbi:hypothetical protein D1007_62389 [Hordeum vulgare]|nr:hypothetical protein D1007_62389 [Hordeum vulgare]
MMTISLTDFPCVLRSILLPIRLFSGLYLATKGIGPLCFTVAITLYLLLVTFHLLRFTAPHHHLLPLISVLAVITFLKTVYHSLLLLVGFDTLTYRKDYD